MDDSDYLDRCVRDFGDHTPTVHENLSHLVLAFVFGHPAALPRLIRQTLSARKEPFYDHASIAWRVLPDKVCNLGKFAQNARRPDQPESHAANRLFAS